MIKINYPIDELARKKLEDSYFLLFKNRITHYLNAIRRLKTTLGTNDRKKLNKFIALYPIKTIITGDIQTLVSVYEEFEKLDTTIKSALVSVFAYDQAKISHFFEKNNHIFNLRSCHYCNLDSVHVYPVLGKYNTPLDFIRFAGKEDFLSIVGLTDNEAESIINIPGRDTLTLLNLSDTAKNAYEKLKGTNIWSGFTDELDFLNRASEKELREIHAVGKVKAREIISSRPYSMGTLYLYPNAEEVYNRLSDITKNGIYRNHFTLDHFIPQKKCGLLEISLYNFVPSCSVCNSKLKGEKLLGNQNTELYTCCPTYKKYDSTGNLQFSLVQKTAVQIFNYSKRDEREQFLENFEIEIESPNTNNRIVTVLHLKQRYSLYKDKAVKLAYLKEKYSEQFLEEIAKILSEGISRHITADDIENDIFNDPLYENESFSKLHRDIKKQVGIKEQR